jgi:hypothetical protein
MLSKKIYLQITPKNYVIRIKDNKHVLLITKLSFFFTFWIKSILVFLIKNSDEFMVKLMTKIWSFRNAGRGRATEHLTQCMLSLTKLLTFGNFTY